jgi:two-component system CheB/CheR fusion protein
MNAVIETPHRPPAQNPEKALALALRLAHAENALLALSSGQVDAIVDPDGKTYLLRPAQENLRQSERRLRALIESAADVITVVARGGRIVSQSRAVRRILGYEPEDLVGSEIFKLVHEDDLPRFYSAFFNVIEGFQDNATAQFRHRTRDGSYRLIEATVGMLRDVPSVSVVFSLRPIAGPLPTYTQPAEPGAPETSRPCGKRELAVLSHWRQTPFMEALLGIAALEEEQWIAAQKPPVEIVWPQHELEARPRQGRFAFTAGVHPGMRLRLTSIDAHEAVRSVLELCRREVAAAQVEVLLYLRAEENWVQADWARLLQAMGNLVRNAVEFSTPGSTISIATTNDAPGRLTFELADHGVGIEPGLLPQVFNSVPQGGLPVLQLGSGLRSGLNIARRLAEAQGGTLTASSQGRGKGATFRLTLNTSPPPSLASAIAPPEEPKELSPPVDPLSILVVEGRGETALARLLERCGHTVYAAPDMLSGITLAENCRFDLVISNLTPADGAGHELIERLRLTRPSLAGIALSGWEGSSDLEQGSGAGRSGRLFTEAALDHLHSAIQAVAAKRREASDETALTALSGGTPWTHYQSLRQTLRELATSIGQADSKSFRVNSPAFTQLEPT